MTDLPLVVQILGAIGVPAGAVIVAILTLRGTRGATATTASDRLLDQLQEELANVRLRLDASERRERVRDDYIGALRRHIDDDTGPPAPAWPPDLTKLE